MEIVERGGVLVERHRVTPEQAKILFAKAATWHPWNTCGLCKQEYHGVVRNALGWACWKTYLGRPEADQARRWAMTELGFGLNAVKSYRERIGVLEVQLAIQKRLGLPEADQLPTLSNMALTLKLLGRSEESLAIKREVYEKRHLLRSHHQALVATHNFCTALEDERLYAEARALLRETIPDARRTLGEEDDLTLRFRKRYATCLCRVDGASRNDIAEAMEILEDVDQRARRVFGPAYPYWADVPDWLEYARKRLEYTPGAARATKWRAEALKSDDDQVDEDAAARALARLQVSAPAGPPAAGKPSSADG